MGAYDAALQLAVAVRPIRPLELALAAGAGLAYFDAPGLVTTSSGLTDVTARARFTAAAPEQRWTAVEADLEVLARRADELDEAAWLNHLTNIASHAAYGERQHQPHQGHQQPRSGAGSRADLGVFAGPRTGDPGGPHCSCGGGAAAVTGGAAAPGGPAGGALSTSGAFREMTTSTGGLPAAHPTTTR